MANEKDEDENITVSKVYETLKSGPFLKKLYWDVLSDFKEKPTFKQMRETTEKLLNKKSEAIANLSNSESDSIQRKTIVAEICSMTYAIDTVYSKILFIKLQKEFESQILDIIKDLRKEKKIPDAVWSQLQISEDQNFKELTEKSTAKNNLPKQKPETSSRPVRAKRQKISAISLATKNREIRSEIHEDLKAINSEDCKVDVPRKNVTAGDQATSKIQTSTPIKRAPKKKLTKEPKVSTNLNPVSKTVEENTATPEELQVDNQESDADSEISVGHVSLTSVSSVHTSDLSSFDDAISLSSDDEDNKKKKIFSLKDFKELCSNGKSDKFNGSKPKKFSRSLKENPKNSAVINHEQQAEVSVDISPDNTNISEESDPKQSSTQKSFPKRIRKPNSKYSSENIVCTITKVKERKKSAAVASDKNPLAVSQFTRKRSKIETSNSEAEVPSKILKIVEETETKPDLRSPLKKYDSPDLYKSHSTVHSLTSRKTTPLTLYST